METKIKAGDVVQLKSGGPAMTVETVGELSNSNGEASVTWFNNNYERLQSRFLVSSLRLKQ
jgi:uncharacterized protein YodC (DUF2158 family)